MNSHKHLDTEKLIQRISQFPQNLRLPGRSFHNGVSDALESNGVEREVLGGGEEDGGEGGQVEVGVAVHVGEGEGGVGGQRGAGRARLPGKKP